MYTNYKKKTVVTQYTTIVKERLASSTKNQKVKHGKKN
jgi:hypothetical protein